MFGKKSKHAKEMQNYIAKANSILSTTKFTDQDKINKLNQMDELYQKAKEHALQAGSVSQQYFNDLYTLYLEYKVGMTTVLDGDGDD